MQQIFIGDVQGCARELRELIRRARHRFGEDCEIWQVGDLVNKGPDNLAALELMREEVDRGRGHFVLGNHDLHLIRVLAGIVPLFPGDSLRDVQESAEAADWLAWLRGQRLVMPLFIDETPALMVHAAVHPRWTLPQCVERARAVEKRLSSPEQDDWVGLLETLPWRSGSVMAEAAAGSGAELRDDLARFITCRSVDPRNPGRWSGQPPDGAGTAWHAAWRLAGHDYGIVFGHWAERRLVVAPGLRGLDTGCVYAHIGEERPGTGCLTAWLPGSAPGDASGGSSPFDCPDESFWRVEPEKAYLSGSEPYTYQPGPPRKGVEVPHASFRGGASCRAGSEVVVVSGLPRGGTSMWMQMLRAGGVPVLADDMRLADEDNPKGYLEWEAVKRLREDDAWLDEAPGRAVKVVAPLLRDLPARHRYAILFSQRDIAEVAASQRAMLRRLGREHEADPEDSFEEILGREVSRVVDWIDRATNVRAFFVDYAEVVRDPLEAAVSVSAFLGRGADASAMAREVDASLYRQRHILVE